MMHTSGTVSDATTTTSAQLALSTVALTGVPTGTVVLIVADVSVTGAADATAVVVTVREGTDTTGSIIEEARSHDLPAATDTVQLTVVVLATTSSADEDYIVTVAVTNASANCTVNSSRITVLEVGST